MGQKNPLIRLPSEPTRLTIFALFALVGLLLGAIGGAIMGYRFLGFPGVFVGVPAGGFLGFALGRLPDFLMSECVFRQMQRRSNAELKAIVDQNQWMFSQTLALLNLQVRGEDVQSYLPRVISLLESDDRLTRRFGLDALRWVFTPEASKVRNYDPNASTEECQACAAMLRVK